MNKEYKLEYWRKTSNHPTQSIEFTERAYQDLKGKFFVFLNNLIPDLGGFCLYKNGEPIERG